MITVSFIFICGALLGLSVLWIRFYPHQRMPIGEVVDIITPEEKYHNDCLHPCIRYYEKSFAGYHYWLVQTPWYFYENKLENPILYKTNNLSDFGDGVVVCDAHDCGYNSDPVIFREGDKLYVFWREYQTPLCNELGCQKATVGVYTYDGITFSEKLVYLTDNHIDSDTEQSPILIKRNTEEGVRYYFYATWYQYKPEPRNNGIAIWEGTSLESPDFQLRTQIPFHSVYTCDKLKQKEIGNHLWFIPKPLKFDLWHFDLLEYQGKLYMIACSNMGENIMFSESEDYVHFTTHRSPLINAHYCEKYEVPRQNLYKPSGFIKDDILYLYYTSTPWSMTEGYNNLRLSTIPINKLIK
jgi:hypothetical protein